MGLRFPGARDLPRAGLVLACALLAGCSSRPAGGGAGANPDARPARHHVTLHGVQFDPTALTVVAGDTVEWDNRDLVPHTVTANDGAFDSGNLAPDSSWSTVIARAGDHPYHCNYHPAMKAAIRVIPR